MKGHQNWSYTPYKPMMFDVGDIYVCRIAPGPGVIHLEWLKEDLDTFEIYYRKRGEEAFLLSGVTAGDQWDIAGLQDETDYEFYVACKDKKSRIRLARTGEAVGTVVNYLHPEDEVYSFSGRYLCSPSLLRHPEGFLLASMDVFAHGHPQNLTLIFRSDDEGATWHYVSELMPCFWGEMFIHNGELYMMGCATEYGDLLIGKSTDGGKTFSAPVAIMRGSNAKAENSGFLRYPQNHMVCNGRIYKTLDWGNWRKQDADWHVPLVASCDVKDDLLVPENWSFSEPVRYDPTWEGTVDGYAKGVVEGTLCVAPDGRLMDVMRYEIMEGNPPYGLVLAFYVNTEDPDAPLEYARAIRFPGNRSKFMIQYDPVSKKYYSLVTRIYSEAYLGARNLLSLMCSEDLDHWELVCDLLDYRHEDVTKVGFQYVYFLFEGEDILYLNRTAMNQAHSYHDANYSTFHRIKNFRDL